VCLNSIANQTYTPIELIVLDNFSTDNTQAIARRYTKLVVEAGPERNSQRPCGVRLSQGDYLMFIDSDMELSPRVVSEAVDRSQRAGCDAVIIPEISGGSGFWARCRRLEKRCFLRDPYMELANRFMRREAYFGVGGYDVTLVGPEDSDIHQKIKHAGYRIGRIDATITHYEENSLRRLWSKYYLYGKYMPVYLRRWPRAGTKQFFFIRPAYVRNWKLFLREPHYGTGLVILNVVRYVAAGLGAIDGYIRGRKEARA
jgi:glycosyltransferase involved in cell wall biosynthesis